MTLLLEFLVYHIPQTAKPNLPYFEINHKFKLFQSSPENLPRNLTVQVAGCVNRRDFKDLKLELNEQNNRRQLTQTDPILPPPNDSGGRGDGKGSKLLQKDCNHWRLQIWFWWINGLWLSIRMLFLSLALFSVFQCRRNPWVQYQTLMKTTINSISSVWHFLNDFMPFIIMQPVRILFNFFLTLLLFPFQYSCLKLYVCFVLAKRSDILSAARRLIPTLRAKRKIHGSVIV